jgi:hypothetical protein
MKRREFITLLSGAAVAWPLAARGQQPAMPVIGYLSPTSLAVLSERLRGLHQGLKEAGYVVGENVASRRFPASAGRVGLDDRPQPANRVPFERS